MEKSYKKKKTSLPVIIVEDHNDVLYHIYRAIGSKKIPFENATMIHFDSHPDLVVPSHLDTERILDKDYIINSLSIENWIVPAMYAGHFNTLVWMKPFWATQLDEGIHKFKVGAEKASKEMKVTCTQGYFVSELSWCPEEDLEGGRDILLQVCTLGAPPSGEKDKDDDTESASGSSGAKPVVLCDDVKEKVEQTPYVLDIDLDFFSTRNPFYSLFTTEQFDLLRKLYHYDHPKEVTTEALKEVTAKRRVQLSDLKSIFQQNVTPTTTTVPPDVQALLSTFPDGRPPDAALLNDAGCTCDECDLPHHVSTRDEVRHLVEEVASFLRRLLPKPPALVTVARSSRDDYCPPEDVDFIQDCVLEMLEDVYGPLGVTQDYESDEPIEEQQPSTSAQ